MAAAFVMLLLGGSCAVWMASPPQPPVDRPVYTVCRAAGLHGYAVECDKSYTPPGVEPGTFGPDDPPARTSTSTPTGRAQPSTAPTQSPNPDIGTADYGPADAGAPGDLGGEGASD